jgi:DNA-binding transcriptional MocR family regulator
VTITSISATRLSRLVGPDALSRPAYRSLAGSIMTLLADGQLPSGTRLPSERELSAAMGCSRTTVTHAYAVLRERDYLTARRGSGSVVALPGRSMVASRALSPALAPRTHDADTIDVTCAATRAPTGILDAYAAALSDLPSYLGDNGYAPLGLPDLRAVLAERYTRAGLTTSPEQIMVTSGAVAGLAVVTRALLRPRDRAVVESPTYPNAVEALRRGGARLTSIPVDPHGWDLDEAERVLRRTPARLAYLIPDFHNPTGAALSDGGRERLAAAVRRQRIVPVIDETIRDIDLDGGPALTPFGCFAPEAIALGSAAKSLWGGLRIGWVRMPRSLAETLLEARVTLDLGAPVLEQLVVLQLLREHPGMPRSRHAELVLARDATVAALHHQLPSARFVVPRGGLNLWVDLGDVAAGTVALVAQEHGLALAPGSRFAPTGGFRAHVRIPYVADAPRMVESIRRLADAVSRVRDGGVTAATPRREPSFVA